MIATQNYSAVVQFPRTTLRSVFRKIIEVIIRNDSNLITSVSLKKQVRALERRYTITTMTRVVAEYRKTGYDLQVVYVWPPKDIDPAVVLRTMKQDLSRYQNVLVKLGKTV